MSPASVYLSPAPLYHAAGVNYTMAVNRVGAASIIMRRFDAETVLRLIETHRVTHAQFVPTMFVRMLKLPEAVRRQVRRLQSAVRDPRRRPLPGGRQAPDDGLVRARSFTSTTAAQRDSRATTIGPQEWLAHPGSVGIPMAPVHVVGEDGHELPVGRVRRTLLRRRPGRSSTSKTPPRPRRCPTNAVGAPWATWATSTTDGYLYLTDRSTFMIVSGGVNIYPQEAENLLVMHPKLVDAAVFGVPNDEFGEEVKAVVQPVAGVATERELEAELIEYCRTHLATYKCPRTIEFDAELPRDPNGKLYKRRIRERYWQGRMSRIV